MGAEARAQAMDGTGGTVAGAEPHRQAGPRNPARGAQRVRAHTNLQYDWRSLGTAQRRARAPRLFDWSFLFPAGDSELAFRGLEPATHPRDVEWSDDSRPLTVMFGVWNWTAVTGS